MRINKFIASATDLSRRGADEAIAAGRVLVDGQEPAAGQDITDQVVTLDGKTVQAAHQTTTIMLNKPRGFVCSRAGQGSRTVYELLPPDLRGLNSVGRLDKDSSGLLLMTDDGQLAYELTHPKFIKVKEYEITLSKPLEPLHRQMISDHGISLDDGLSKLQLTRFRDGDDLAWIVRMHEGRNRQIRRTFMSLGYDVVRLHRVSFGRYELGALAAGDLRRI